MKRSRYILIIVVTLLTIAGCLFYLIGIRHDSRSLEERLADIEAARMILDSENAARIYDELIEDPNAAEIKAELPASLSDQTYNRLRWELWHSREHPELAAWIDKQRPVIDRLVKVCQFEKCRFPVSSDFYDTSDLYRLSAMWAWAEMLSLAANNDIAEGRADAAITEWQCLIQLANHARQQPAFLNHVVANSAHGFVGRPLAGFIVDGNPTEAQLQAIEALPQPLTDRWAEYLRDIRLVDDLYNRNMRKGSSALRQMKSYLSSRLDYTIGKARKEYDETGRTYLGDIAMGRAIRVLVALRRYRSVAGHWPESLDEVRASLPAEALIDPFNRNPVVYRPQGDSFRLYSTGWNKRDESGGRESLAGDDWPLWPLPPLKSELEQQEQDAK